MRFSCAGIPLAMDITNNTQPSEDISLAADFILKGGIGAVPTETVYGLAADAFNAGAVRKIFEAKGRPFIDPLIVHVCDMQMAESVAEFSTKARVLAEKFWAGPLTLILKKRANVPDIVTAGLQTVAVRMPAHPVMRELIKTCQRPLAAPSANPFGYVSPTTAQHVAEQLGDKIDFILDGGKCSRGVESTIIALSDSAAPHKLLRAGPISPEELEAVLGEKIDVRPKKNEAHPEAPGMLKSHYSPSSKLTLFNSIEEVRDTKENVIFLKKPLEPKKNHYWLSESGDLAEAATNLFALLRALDKISPNGFFCQRPPIEGIGLAINDRLERAETKL